jgi:hypothetical protein
VAVPAANDQAQVRLLPARRARSQQAMELAQELVHRHRFSGRVGGLARELERGGYGARARYRALRGGMGPVQALSASDPGHPSF